MAVFTINQWARLWDNFIFTFIETETQGNDALPIYYMERKNKKVNKISYGTKPSIQHILFIGKSHFTADSEPSSCIMIKIQSDSSKKQQ